MKQTEPQVIIAGRNLSQMTPGEIVQLCLEASRSRQVLILELVEKYLINGGTTKPAE